MQWISQFIIGNVNIWSPLLVIVIGFFSKQTKRYDGRVAVCEKMLSWFFFFSIGLLSLLGAVMHIFFGNFTAKTIGWLPSPFQYEVGVANLVFAVLGFWAFGNKNYQFRKAVVVGFFIWFLGDAAGHIYQYFIYHNTAAYNAGSTLYSDIYLPIMAVILLRCSKRRGLMH